MILCRLSDLQVEQKIEKLKWGPKLNISAKDLEVTMSDNRSSSKNLKQKWLIYLEFTQESLNSKKRSNI